MYGLALPLLYPIAVLYLVVFYFIDRILITYYYKKPPMYDDKLNKEAISILKWAPFVMSAFGYWIFGNDQIFGNEVVGKSYKSKPALTKRPVI